MTELRTTPRIEPELPTVARVTIEGGEEITENILEQLYDLGYITLTPPIVNGVGGCSLLLASDYNRVMAAWAASEKSDSSRRAEGEVL